MMILKSRKRKKMDPGENDINSLEIIKEKAHKFWGFLIEKENDMVRVYIRYPPQHLDLTAFSPNEKKNNMKKNIRSMLFKYFSVYQKVGITMKFFSTMSTYAHF